MWVPCSAPWTISEQSQAIAWVFPSSRSPPLFCVAIAAEFKTVASRALFGFRLSLWMSKSISCYFILTRSGASFVLGIFTECRILPCLPLPLSALGCYSIVCLLASVVSKSTVYKLLHQCNSFVCNMPVFGLAPLIFALFFVFSCSEMSVTYTLSFLTLSKDP